MPILINLFIFAAAFIVFALVTTKIFKFMNDCFYYPSDSKGNLLKGFCPTRGSITSYLKDCRIWSTLGLSHVVLNGNLHTL